MDDFIYFIMLIAWLAFSFYQQSAKKKKKQEQMLAAKEREEMQSHQEEDGELHDDFEEDYNSQPEKEKQPEYKDLIEKILMGEELSQHNPSTEKTEITKPVAEIKNERDNIVQNKNIFQKYYDKKIAGEPTFDSHIVNENKDNLDENEDEIVLQEVDNQDFHDPEENFDLRKAIIYSEILNRRYTN